MKWFANLKMANKLKLGFGLCLALSVLSCFVAVQRLGQLNAGAKNIVDDPLAGVVNIGKISGQARMLRTIEFRNAVPGSQVKAAEIKEVFDKAVTEIKTAMDKYEPSAILAEDKTNVAKLKEMWNEYQGGYSEIVALAGASKFKAAQQLVTARRDKFYALCDQIDLMIGWNAKRGATLAAEATAIYQSGRNTIIGLLVVSALSVFGIGIAISRSITADHVPLEITQRDLYQQSSQSNGRDGTRRLDQASGYRHNLAGNRLRR